MARGRAIPSAVVVAIALLVIATVGFGTAAGVAGEEEIDADRLERHVVVEEVSPFLPEVVTVEEGIWLTEETFEEQTTHVQDLGYANLSAY